MIEIKELFKAYEQNISDFLQLCHGKNIVFDFDGTLTKFDYAQDRMLPCLDDNIQEYTLAGGNIYQDVKILKTMQYIFSKLGRENVWVLTSSVPALRNIKSEIIHKHFGISYNKIIHSDNALHKLFFLKQIYEQENKQIIFIEDTAKTLLNAEECMDFVKGYHISNFLA